MKGRAGYVDVFHGIGFRRPVVLALLSGKGPVEGIVGIHSGCWIPIGCNTGISLAMESSSLLIVKV